MPGVSFRSGMRHDGRRLVGGLVLIVVITIALYVCVGLVAWRLNRSPLGWILLGLAVSPIVVVVVLLLLGHRRDSSQASDVAHGNPTRCPQCGNRIDMFTGVGLVPSPDEPWRLYCEHCSREITPDL